MVGKQHAVLPANLNGAFDKAHEPVRPSIARAAATGKTGDVQFPCPRYFLVKCVSSHFQRWTKPLINTAASARWEKRAHDRKTVSTVSPAMPGKTTRSDHKSSGKKN